MCASNAFYKVGEAVIIDEIILWLIFLISKLTNICKCLALKIFKFIFNNHLIKHYVSDTVLFMKLFSFKNFLRTLNILGFFFSWYPV